MFTPSYKSQFLNQNDNGMNNPLESGYHYGEGFASWAIKPFFGKPWGSLGGEYILKIVEAENRSSQLIERLVEVWNSSVRSTHLFLSSDEIDNIRPYVRQALREVPMLIVEEDEHTLPVAFMGIDMKKLEMLFVSNAYRNKGIGKIL